MLADYFESQSAGPRRTDELPWQLAQGRVWQRLQDLLTEQEFFMASWEANEYDVKAYWAELEKESYHKVNAYRAVIDNPYNADDNFVWNIATLLNDTGHPVEALDMRASLTERFRKSGNMNNYQKSLGAQAIILYARGELDEAMKLYKEQERICMELFNINSLQLSLGNQANIFYARGEIDEAMKLYKKQERICKDLGDKDNLQASLGNQALILYARGELDEAMKLHKEQERICRELGNKNSLQGSLGNQACILYARGEIDEAMKLLKEQERICRELGTSSGLAQALNNQAVMLSSKIGQNKEALPLAEEAYNLAMKSGQLALAKQIKSTLDLIRSRS